MHELGSICSFTQARKTHFSIMINMHDCCGSDLGSIPGQVCQFLTILFYQIHLIRRDLWKNSYGCCLFWMRAWVTQILHSNRTLSNSSNLARNFGKKLQLVTLCGKVYTLKLDAYSGNKYAQKYEGLMVYSGQAKARSALTLRAWSHWTQSNEKVKIIIAN